MIMGLFDFSLGDVGETLVKAREAITGKRVIDEAEILELDGKLDQIQQEFEKTVTERWHSDNEHAVTRLVRPGIVMWVYAIFSIVLLADGNIGEFSIKSAYIPLIETVLVTVTVAYFGSRGIEKTSKVIKAKK